MRDALLVIDIQNDYFPGGAMELAGMEAAGARAAEALQAMRGRSAPVYFLQHLSTRPGAAFFLPGTAGAELHPCVTPRPGEAVITKHFPNGFRETALLERLRDDGVEHLVICGAMSHMCVDATTRAAFDLGFRCTVLADACATRDLQYQGRTVRASDVHAAFMAALAVPYASVIATGDLRAGEDG